MCDKNRIFVTNRTSAIQIQIREIIKNESVREWMSQAKRARVNEMRPMYIRLFALYFAFN